MKHFLITTSISALLFTSVNTFAGVDDIIDDQDWIPKIQLVANEDTDQADQGDEDQNGTQQNGTEDSDSQQNGDEDESSSDNDQNGWSDDTQSEEDE